MRKRLSALCLGLSLLLAGCWSRVEVNDLAVVLALGIDKGQEERVRVTLYIARAVSTGSSGTQQMPNSVWVVAREADNVTDAIYRISQASGRRISLHHVRMVLAGEDYARERIYGLDDFEARNVQLRLTARPLVVRGRAQTLLETLPQLRQLQPNNIIGMLDAARTPRHTIKEFLVARSSLTHSGWMQGVQVIQRPAGLPDAPPTGVELNGAGLFREDRLVTWLDRDETQALHWLMGEAKGGVFTAGCPGEPGHTFTARIMEGKASIQPFLSGQQPSFTVRAYGKLEMQRIGCAKTNVMNSPDRFRLERLLEDVVRARIQRMIAAVQESHTDPVGFGKRLELKYPRYWDQIAVRWPEIFSKVPVRTAVDLQLQNSGALIRPVNPTPAEMKGFKE